MLQSIMHNIENKIDHCIQLCTIWKTICAYHPQLQPHSSVMTKIHMTEIDCTNLYALSVEGQALEVNYLCSIDEIYLRCTRKSIKQHKSLNILYLFPWIGASVFSEVQFSEPWFTIQDIGTRILQIKFDQSLKKHITPCAIIAGLETLHTYESADKLASQSQESILQCTIYKEDSPLLQSTECSLYASYKRCYQNFIGSFRYLSGLQKVRVTRP